MENNKAELFRMIPAVDRLLEYGDIKTLSSSHSRNLTLKIIHEILDELREKIEKGEIDKENHAFLPETISVLVKKRLELAEKPSLRNVINATGIIIHTNLGRSILAERIIKRFREISGGYSNLEYNLEEGKRGSRYTHVEGILREITSAEAAMVVNNNAAAVLISLETLARDREVIISRGELVEIGGSFRIPDVMKKSGARMVEVGTTNKTHPEDYENAIGPETAIIMKVHKSNFQIVGFGEEVERTVLVELGRKYGLPVVEDLGSGCLIDFSKYGLSYEPTVQEVLSAGVDLVTFSGDKLLGGPQAGIILGRKDLVEEIKRNQLNRALRIDKLTLFALEETLNIYRDEKTALEQIPTLRMICQPYENIRARARRIMRMIDKSAVSYFNIEPVRGFSRAGGGALPLLELPTCLLRLFTDKLSANFINERLKSCDPPIIVRVEEDSVLFDLRTIQDNEFKTVATAINGLVD